jgi:hypothetical protein
MRIGVRCVVALLTTVVGAGRIAAQAQAIVPDSAIAGAERAARAWFALLADRNYAAGWEQASGYFREHVSREQWGVNARRLDRQFVRTDERRLVEARWLRDEPPLQPSEYVVLRWLTVIDDWHQVGERIIMAHESDGSWRPATYDLFPNVDGAPIAVRGAAGPPPAPPIDRPRTITAPRRP